MSTKSNAVPSVTAAGSSEGTAAYPRPDAPLTPLGDLLAELAAARPDHPAITTGHRTVTRDDVEQRVWTARIEATEHSRAGVGALGNGAGFTGYVIAGESSYHRVDCHCPRRATRPS